MKNQNLNFSWKQFWVTFIYENLPPVLLSPLAALFIERSLVRAWYVCENRNLWSLSKKYRPLSAMIFSWFLVYPSSWIITVGFFATLFSQSNATSVDSYQIVLAYMFLFLRRLIISVKYAYFTVEEFEALAQPAPEWTFDRSTRKLVGIGWSSPTNFPGLLESEIDFSIKNLRSDFEKSQIFLRPVSNTESDGDIQLSPKSLFTAIIRTVYATKKPQAYDAYVVIMALSIAIVPPLFHSLLYPDSFFILGGSLLGSIARFLACMSGIGIMGFGLVCAFDFKRRYQALKILRSLVDSEGLNMQRFLNFKSAEPNLNYKLSLLHPGNVIVFMEIRNCIIRFGEQFYLRIQGYTSILILAAFFAVIMLNSIIWTQASHHAATVVMILSIILAIGSISLFAMFNAIRLQQQRIADIDFLRTECLAMECSITAGNATSPNNDAEQRSISILQSAIDTATFNDLTHAPTSILGQAADNKLITSVLGILITGCLLAVQGFVDIGTAYDALGWSTSEQTN